MHSTTKSKQEALTEPDLEQKTKNPEHCIGKRKKKKKHLIVIRTEDISGKLDQGSTKALLSKVTHSLQIFLKQILLCKVKIYKGKFNYTSA